MAEFKTDLRDIYFNLFTFLKSHHNRENGQDDYQDLKEIVMEFNKFIGNEIWPTRIASDRDGVKIINGQVKVAPCLHGPHKKFYDNGWFALGMPEEWGGMSAPHAVVLACNSLLTGANVGYSMYPGLTKAALNVIIKIGSEQQKKTFIEKIMTGVWGGTMCLTEPGAGSDVGACRTTATPLGQGKYSVKGVKIFISSGESDLYQNNIHLVLARTPGAPEGTKGLSLFIVPRFEVNTMKANNVVCTKIEEKMGIHSSATCELTFGRDGDCIGELIGKEFDGMANMFIMMNEARLLCGQQGESQANLAYQLTAQYAMERVQFGKEIAHHPDVARMLLRMRAQSRGMRALTLYVGNLFDLAHNNKELDNEIALLTPICKAYCSEKGFEVAVDAIQIHGGYGFCTEYGIEQFCRDTKIATIYEGTNGIQAMDFVFRKVLKDQGKTFNQVAMKIQKTLECAQTSSIASEIAEELSLIKCNLEDGNKILVKVGQLAVKNKNDEVLSCASDILDFSSQLVVGWLLLEHAIAAAFEIKNANGIEEKDYLESKIIDFKIYCRHFLTKNISIAHHLLNFKDNLMQYKA